MKNLRVFTLLILLCPLAKAQDTILKADQTEVSVKVTEITTDEVKFKYFSRLNGPVYTLKKSEVFVIIYQDGTREKFGQSPAPANVAPTSSKNNDTASPTTTPSTTESKRSGFAYGLAYATPTQAFGQANGLGISGGYYFLGRGRKGGGIIDTDALYFFNDGKAQYGLISLNGVFRGSENSRFYMGGGAGLGSVSVEIATYDYLLKRTTTKRVGDFGFGGKAFMGYGLFRVSVLIPSFDSIQGGGLLTIGLYTNPFGRKQ